MVMVSSYQVMIIGGRTKNKTHSDATYIYDLNNETWTRGPTLIFGRHDHAAGMITDHKTKEKFVVVVGGQGTNISLKSVEVLFDINIGRWIEKHPTLSVGMYLINDGSGAQNWIFG